MCSAGEDSTEYDIPGDPFTSYNKPIAVLVGPGCLSAGDQVALRMKFHPYARFFGKSTATAFNDPTSDYDTGGSPLNVRFAELDAYLLSDPSNHLTHDEFPVDEPVWLTPDDVAQGVDTVAQAALAWIQSQVTAVPDFAEAARIPILLNSPNPFGSHTTIHYSAFGPRRSSLSIYDVTGRLVRVVVNGDLREGDHTATWDGRDAAGLRVSGGTYFVKLTAGDVTRTRKVVFLGGK
jgi:hypothetical protein